MAVSIAMPGRVTPISGCHPDSIAKRGYSPRPTQQNFCSRNLAKPGYRCEVISLGANTDPYQPADRELRITRAILEVFHENRHPVGIVTKSSLIARETDLLEAAASEGASSAGYVILRLPYEVKDIVREWLDIHYPLRARHVMARVNDKRVGRACDNL